MRLMADSTNPFDIPRGQFPIVAGYIDGLYAWSAAGWQFHSDSALVTITATTGDTSALAADVENGDLTAVQAADWAFQRAGQGLPSLVYFSASRFGEIAAAMAARGVPAGAWQTWVALWDDNPDLQPGWTAHQYANPPLTGAHYDLSVVADYVPGLDALPVPSAYAGAAGAVSGWSSLGFKLDGDLPAFASELGVIASGLTSLG